MSWAAPAPIDTRNQSENKQTATAWHTFFLKLEIPSKRPQRGTHFRRLSPPHVLRSGARPPAWHAVGQRLRKNERSAASWHTFYTSKRPQRGTHFSKNPQTAAAWQSVRKRANGRSVAHIFFFLKKSSEHRANGRSVAYVFEDSCCRVD